MRYGTLKELSQYLSINENESINSFIDKYKDFQLNKWHSLNGDDFKVILLDKDNYEEGLFETHKKYIDIHIVIKGSDSIFLAEEKKIQIINDYNTEFDYCLGKGICKEKLIVKENQFCLLLPEEFHSNKISGRNALKIVAKKIYNEKNSSLYNC